MPPTNSCKTIQRPAALPGVEVHFGQASRDVDAHRYLAHYAVAAIDGAVCYQYRGKRYERSGRHVVLGEAGEFISACTSSDVSFHHWWIAPELMQQAAEERGQSLAPRFAQDTIEDPRAYRPLILAMAALARSTEALDQQESLTRLLDMVLGEHVDGGRAIYDVVAHRAVRRMRDLIHDSYDQELSLDLLACHARLNKFYALRAFKREMGVTPHCYQLHLRVGKARQMLRAGQKSTEVAHALGFCDQSHFVRTFHEMTLVTPRRYQISA